MNAMQRRLIAAMPCRLGVACIDTVPSYLQALKRASTASSSPATYEAQFSTNPGCQLVSACFGWWQQTAERRTHSLSNLSSTTTISGSPCNLSSTTNTCGSLSSLSSTDTTTGGSSSDFFWRQHRQVDYQPIKRRSRPEPPGGGTPCHGGRFSSFRAFSSLQKQSSPRETQQQSSPLQIQQQSSPLQNQQHRWQHSVATPGDSKFVYKGPLSQAVKNLKRLSIAGCAASLVGAPLMVLVAGEAMPLAAKASIILTIGGFGVFTTSLLHWFTGPYVHSLVYDRHTGSVEAQTVNILGRQQTSRFHVAEAAYPDTIRPQVTFEVKGRFFYLDADNFGDKQLLAKLSPPDPAGDSNVPSH